MAKHNVTGEQDLNIDKQMVEIKRQIRQKSGSPINPELVALALQDIIEGNFAHIASKKEDIFTRLLSKFDTIIIDACDGKETLADAKDVFRSNIDPNFKILASQHPGENTEETLVEVHEVIKDSTFEKMFGSIGNNLNKLCLTQSQIKNFCKKHQNWLRTDGYATFFVFKVNGLFFVASVSVTPHGLVIYIDRFKDITPWHSNPAYRLVVPRQEV